MICYWLWRAMTGKDVKPETFLLDFAGENGKDRTREMSEADMKAEVGTLKKALGRARNAHNRKP